MYYVIVLYFVPTGLILTVLQIKDKVNLSRNYKEV